MCPVCEAALGKMFYEYQVRGTHNYYKSDLCCNDAKEWYIPLENYYDN